MVKVAPINAPTQIQVLTPDVPVGSEPTVESADLERLLRSRLEAESASSAADAVFAVLSAAIISRDLPPGWRLAEERLAAMFRLSRTPVREALTRLAGSGLVSRDQRGTLRVEIISAERILEVYAVRGALEGLSASLAAQSATTLMILEFQHLSDAYAAAGEIDNITLMAELNLDFHLAIARSTRNELLVRTIEQIHGWIRRIPTTTLSYPGRIAASIAQHRDLVAAIRARNPEDAERIARQHMREAEAARVAMLAHRA